MTTSSSRKPHVPGRRTFVGAGVVAAIVTAIILNNIDRQMLALIKPLLDVEFGWSADSYGRITTASQISAALCLPLMGWIVDRVSPCRGLGWGVGVWSAFTVAQAVATGFQSMLAIRVALTGAEAIGTPAALKLMGTAIPARGRALALGLFNMAPSLGAMIGPVIVPLLAWSFGWRTAAVAMGALGAIWAVWWLRVSRMHADPLLAQPAVHHASIASLRNPATWLLIAAKGLTDQLWWVFLYWLPVFLHQSSNGAVSGWAGSVTGIYIWAALGSLAGAFALPHWRTGPGLRAQLAVAGCSAAVASLLILGTAPLWALSVAACALAIFGHQILSVLIFSEISDARYRARTGTIAGMGAFAGNLLAVLSLTLVSRSAAAGTDHVPALLGLAGAYLLGGACMVGARMLQARAGV